MVKKPPMGGFLRSIFRVWDEAESRIPSSGEHFRRINIG